MNFKTYDTAFVQKLGADKLVNQKGYWITVAGITAPVPCLFDQPEEWWAAKIGKTEGNVILPAVNVRRVDLIPDPSRFLPGFRGKEVSETDPNMMNLQKDPVQPITLLYEVQMATDHQETMNALLLHTLLKLPTAGFGSSLSVFGRIAPVRINSVRNYAWNMARDEGRKFIWSYTYAVDAWMTTTECVKVPRILQVDLTFTDGAEYAREVSVS